MKYIRTFENKNTDIFYLAKKQGAYSGSASRKYVEEVIEYYKLTNEQIHNLRLALEYDYLDFKDFRNILGQIINSDNIWTDFDSERKLKEAFKTNFKTKIINVEEPYPICYLTWNKYKWDINTNNDLNSFDFNDIIGEIPKEYPFDKKYLIGKGRYRDEQNNSDVPTLWEKYRNTKRESEFIRVVNEKDIYILTDNDIKNIEIINTANKYNL